MFAESYTLTDTHTHIYYHAGTDKLEDQMQRCFDRQINRLFLPNVDRASIEPVMHTVAAYPANCFPMLGLHPCSVKEDYKTELAYIEKALAEHKVYAIGEIGLEESWIGVAVRANNLIYLFDEKGGVYDGFPIEAMPQFYYGKIDYNSSNYLLCVRRDKKLYAFKN